MVTKCIAFTNAMDILHVMKKSLKFSAWMGKGYILNLFNAELEPMCPYNPDNDRGFPLL